MKGLSSAHNPLLTSEDDDEAAKRRLMQGLDGLLSLDDVVMEVGDGWWIKISAHSVPKTEDRSHGIDYSLTLHDSDDQRRLGYDNAHIIKIGTGPGAKQSETRDHMHKGERVIEYSFESPEKLLEDFWTDVAKILAEEGVT